MYIYLLISSSNVCLDLRDTMHRDEEKIHIRWYNVVDDEHIEYIHEDQNSF